MRALTSIGSLAVAVSLASVAGAQDFGPDGSGNIGQNIPNAFSDISGSGANITAGFGANLDDAGQVIPIGFTFNHPYGGAITTIGVSTNGYLADDGDLTDFTNDCPIASATTPNRGIYPYWDDLRLTEHGSVFTQLNGVAPARVLIVQFDDVGTFDDSTASLTFQAQLKEEKSAMEYHYGDMISAPAFDATGAGATIGIEANGGADGLQIVCDQAGTITSNTSAFRIEFGVQAAQVTRAGSCPNPVAFMGDPAGGPTLGNTWSPSIDHTTFATGSALDFYVISPNPTDVATSAGCVLCIFNPIVLVLLAPGQVFDFPVPNLCKIQGEAFCAQAGSLTALPGGVGIELANALDIVVGNFN